MSNEPDGDPFYIGYLPKSPPMLARFTRRAVIGFALGALGLSATFAVALPYFGAGEFDFGHARDLSGTVRCEMVPRLLAGGTEYLLVGYGKNGVAPEICGATGRDVTLRGTLIRRDGRQLLEVADDAPSAIRTVGGPAPVAAPLGRFTLTGEIVDSKCYFGVMNPAEGRAHRACAVQCLRGGVPAVFVVHDRTGAVAHLLVAGPEGRAINSELLRWVGESVEASGEVVRQGQWLVWRIDPATLRLAGS